MFALSVMVKKLQAHLFPRQTCAVGMASVPTLPAGKVASSTGKLTDIFVFIESNSLILLFEAVNMRAHACLFCCLLLACERLGLNRGSRFMNPQMLPLQRLLAHTSQQWHQAL